MCVSVTHARAWPLGSVKHMLMLIAFAPHRWRCKHSRLLLGKAAATAPFPAGRRLYNRKC